MRQRFGDGVPGLPHTYVKALVEMAQASTGWWERYRGILPQGLLDIAEAEGNAVRIRGANTVHVPGMLVAGQEDHPLADSLEALRTLITGIKAGKADHLL